MLGSLQARSPPVYAIIEDSGTQIKVAEGDIVDVDLRDVADDSTSLSFDRVLMLGNPDGEATLGRPYVDGASVAAEIMGEVKGEKLVVFKFKRRKGYRRKQGHRQRYLRVKIGAINAG
jgi:large subunit ribosomal protein L21